MGLYGAWMAHDVGGPGYIREYGDTAYLVKIVRGTRGTAYDVSRRAPGYGGNTYLGQFRTRDGAFRVAARDAKIRGLTARSNPQRKLSVPEQHQLKIARQTLKYSDAGARIMGGMTKEEARRIIRALTGKAPRENPRKKRNSGRRRPIRQSMRVVARGVQADVRRVFGGRGLKDFPITLIGDKGHTVKQREAVARLTRRFKLNPMSRKDFEYMAAVIADAQLQGAPVNVLAALTNFSVDFGKRSNPRFDADRFARRILQLVSEKAPWRYVNKNPRRNPLAVFGANPHHNVVKTVRDLGRVMEIRYKRKDDGKFYKHPFKTRPRLLALSDGTIAVRP